jgi:hypothetical protein
VADPETVKRGRIHATQHDLAFKTQGERQISFPHSSAAAFEHTRGTLRGKGSYPKMSALASKGIGAEAGLSRPSLQPDILNGPSDRRASADASRFSRLSRDSLCQWLPLSARLAVTVWFTVKIRTRCLVLSIFENVSNMASPS